MPFCLINNTSYLILANKLSAASLVVLYVFNKVPTLRSVNSKLTASVGVLYCTPLLQHILYVLQFSFEKGHILYYFHTRKRLFKETMK